MARVTVEDCVRRIPNRFDLVMLASQRARAVASGAPLTVERDRDKNPVVALREIAEETVSIEELAQAAIHDLRKHAEVDEPEDDDMDLLMGRAASDESAQEGREASEPEPANKPEAGQPAVKAEVKAEVEAEVEAKVEAKVEAEADSGMGQGVQFDDVAAEEVKE